MSKILGKYIIRANVSTFTSGFAFANDNRNRHLTLNDDEMLNCYCSDFNRPVNSSVHFVANSVLKVRAARIVTPGAIGLRPALTDPAGVFFIQARKANDATSDTLGAFMFDCPYFNEWQPMNFDFLPDYKSAENNEYWLSINSQYSSINFEDFNIQSIYEGETFNVGLELQLDTAGILDYDGKVF